MQGKHESVDNITEKLLQKKIINEDVCNSIKGEKGSLLKAKLFYDVISKCDNEGLEALLHGLHSSPNYSGFCRTSCGESMKVFFILLKLLSNRKSSSKMFRHSEKQFLLKKAFQLLSSDIF